ncbi:hypothetical protein SAY87_021574 [Trapa incisa]|uniref:Uncharacterized protein n=1 Tax=Trapa incisa TaxID=236973 RepID=A0AAN7PRQ7_9MYRT|nr:hypothetical protein SAY87_021574 [Trapa incisa]
MGYPVVSVPITLCCASYEACNSFQLLSPTDRFGILDDSFALCMARQLPLTSLLKLMSAYREEHFALCMARQLPLTSLLKLMSAYREEQVFADIKRAAYVAVMQTVNSSDRSGYESLLRVYRESDLSQEKT